MFLNDALQMQVGFDVWAAVGPGALEVYPFGVFASLLGRRPANKLTVTGRRQRLATLAGEPAARVLAEAPGSVLAHVTGARKGVKRIIFASSNHAIGLYRRDERLDQVVARVERSGIVRVPSI